MIQSSRLIVLTAVVLDWTFSPNNTDTLYLTINGPFLETQISALFANYAAKSVNILVCPADNCLSSAQRAMGWKNRMRSRAMNGAMGDGSKWYRYLPNGQSDGGHSSTPAFYEAKKASDMHNPSPSNCFVILDENPPKRR